MNECLTFRFLVALMGLALVSTACGSPLDEPDLHGHDVGVDLPDAEQPDAEQPDAEQPDADHPDAPSQPHEPLCEPAHIEEPTTLDLRVEVVHIDGELRHESGAALPDSPDPAANRGVLAFVNHTTGEYHFARVSAQGAASYSAALFPGTYAVLWMPDAATLETLEWNRSFMIEPHVVIDATTTLDLVAPDWVEVTIQMLVNGWPTTSHMLEVNVSPDALQPFAHHAVQASWPSHMAMRVELDDMGAFRLLLPQGPYTAEFLTRLSFEGQSVRPPGDVQWTVTPGMQPVVVDLDAVVVSGRLLLGGRPLPVAMYGRNPALQFCPKSTTTCTSSRLVQASDDDDHDFQLATLTGPQVVRLVREPLHGELLPEQLAELELDITEDTRITIDLPAGAVHAELPAVQWLSGGSGVTRLRLVSTTLANTPIDITCSGRSCTGLVPEGEYDISVVTIDHPFGSVPLLARYENEMPLGRHTVGPQGLTLDAWPQLAHVTGRLTLDGRELPSGSTIQPRGTLILRGRDHGQQALIPLGNRGPVSFDLTLRHDVYEVIVESRATNPSSHLPVGRMTLHDDLVIDADTTLELDLPYVDVTGRVTLNGQAPAASPQYGRGTVFALQEGSSALAAIPLETEGDSTFTQRLFPVEYTFVLRGRGGATHPALPVDARLLTTVDLSNAPTLEFDVEAIRTSGTIAVDGLEPGAFAGSAPPVGYLVFNPTDVENLVVHEETFLPLSTWASLTPTDNGLSYEVMLYPGRYLLDMYSANESALPTAAGRVEVCGE